MKNPPNPLKGGLKKRNLEVAKKRYGIQDTGYSLNRDPFRGKPGSPEYLTALARKLRLNMTECEELLWEKLAKKKLMGLRFRRQHIIGRYVVDFYCHSHKLVVEIEGPVHDTQQDYDETRFGILETLGYQVMRIKNGEILKDMSLVLDTIMKVARRYNPLK